MCFKTNHVQIHSTPLLSIFSIKHIHVSQSVNLKEILCQYRAMAWDWGHDYLVSVHFSGNLFESNH